jgi:hypothetical protein
MGNLVQWPIKESDGNGVPLAGAKLYSYYANTDEEKPLYTDSAATTEAANPIVFDADGRCVDNSGNVTGYLGIGTYKLILKDSLGNLIWQSDDVAGAGTVTLSSVATIAALRALQPGQFASVFVIGYYAAGDNGGGWYVWSASSNSSDDGGGTIKPASNPSYGRWLLVNDGYVTPYQFGAYGNGITNDTNAIIAADAYAYEQEGGIPILFTKGIFLIDSLGLSNVKFMSPAMISVNSGNTIAINKIDGDPLWQIFYGEGTIEFAEKTIPHARPEWFGALSDDTVDCTDAINAAIANCDKVKLIDGTYKITARLVLRSNVSIEGTGKDTTIIKQYSDTDAFYGVYPTVQNSIVIKDLQVTDALRLAGTRTGGHGIYLNGTGGEIRPIISNVQVIGFYDGINIYNGSYMEISGDSRIVFAKQDGISLTGVAGQAVNIQLENPQVVGNGRYGLYMSGITYFGINGVVSDSNTSHGFYFLNCSNGCINNTTSEGNSGHGYFISGGSCLTFNSPSASKISTQDGIHIEGAYFTVLNAPSIQTVTGYGISANERTSPARSLVDVFVTGAYISDAGAGNYYNPLSKIYNFLTSVYYSGSDFYIVNDVSNGDIIFKVNKGGVSTEVMRLDGATGNAGIGQFDATKRLNVYTATDDIWAAHFESGATTAGKNQGVLIDAGSNSSDFSLYVRNKAGASPYFYIKGDGTTKFFGTTELASFFKLMVPAEFADDAAAASTIAVGQTYRTGSVLKVRVS